MPQHKLERFENVRKILKSSDRCGYLTVSLSKGNKGKMYNIHRLIALAFIDNPENKRCVDHIDNNKVNINISNLRWCTNSENSRNIGLCKRSTSGVKGVRFEKRRNKWYARIVIDGIVIHLGSYDTIEEETEARVKRANEAFGNFTNACEKVSFIHML
jgi:hypothetical protein